MSQTTDRLWGARFKSGPSEALAALSRCPERYFRLTPVSYTHLTLPTKA